MRDSKSMALNIRKDIVELAHLAGKKGIHLGSSLSIVEILAVLYSKVLKYHIDHTDSEDRDIFILSKGHGYACLYSTLCEAGFFDKDTLYSNFMTDNGYFPVHPVKNLKLGIEFSGGSLGTGVSFAVGKALALKLQGRSNKVYTLLGDGECNEGSVWEALVSASHYDLNNLTIIIDKNNLQQDGNTVDVMNLDIEKISKSLGFNTISVDGHSVTELESAFLEENANTKPKLIIANTIKGKGISFVEGNNAWHHASMSEKQYKLAFEELNN